MKKTVWREIKNSLGRFVAILAIIALGMGFLVGLLVTKPAMIDTLQGYTQKTNFYDWKLLSTTGYEAANVSALADLPGVNAAEGVLEKDVLCRLDDGSETVYKAISITEQINRLDLSCGRMPQAPNECVADWVHYNAEDLGKVIRLSPDNEEDTLSLFTREEYIIVGVATSPDYINFERGNTNLGTGSVSAYFYIPYDGFDADYFSEILLCVDTEGGIYTDAYQDSVERSEDTVTLGAETQADARYDRILAEYNQDLADAQKEYDDGEAEYIDGLAEYEEKKADAQRELDEAYEKLLDAERQIDDGWAEYRDGIDTLHRETEDGRQKLDEAREELDDALIELNDAEQTYADAKQELADGENDYADGLAQYEDGLSQLTEGQQKLADAQKELDAAAEGITAGGNQLREAEAQLNAQQAQVDALVAGVNAALGGTTYSAGDLTAAVEAGDPTVLYVLNSVLAYGGTGMTAEQFAAGYRLLESGWEDYRNGLMALQDGSAQYTVALDKVAQAKMEIEENRQKLDTAKEELDDARKELDDGWQELADGRRELDENWADYYSGLAELADGERELQEETDKAEQTLREAYDDLLSAQQETAEGWDTYAQSKADAQEQLDDAAQELRDGREELDEAKEKIADARAELDKLEPPTVYVLGRNANIGYVCFESDTNIVAGIAKVFPVFFFLVAALVCITTMTRMVDEQRTQIGVLKAMGFSSGHIIGKYLLYSGSASLIGCVLGFFVGSYVFPTVIWQAYCMMYGFDELTLHYDLLLGAAASAAYIAISSGATWLACRNELQNVPAVLMRPKAPKAGKRIFLERFPFLWKRVGFLHKVSIRNIILYKQRMLMMILGIGGCTALLVTGFGIKDSIKNVVNFQYDEISLYEYAVSFSNPQTPESAAQALTPCEKNMGTYQLVYEGNMDMDVDGTVKSAYVVMPAEGELTGLVDLHDGDRKLPYPGQGEAAICVNLAEALGLHVGDNFTLRNSDAQSLQLTVSGIFDNYIYNYIYTSPDTFLSQWGALPDMKTVYAQALPESDVGVVAAHLLDCEGVNAVSSAEQLEKRIDGMMSSMDYIVLLIIVCSGALAFIVLYNLTNINLTERLREIATIKVLGFYPRETSSYVFREIFVLTGIGAVIGLGLGILLHAFVMGQIQIDLMHFDRRIAPVSFLMSAVLTFVFTGIVNLFMYFKLERINMAEALKSIE